MNHPSDMSPETAAWIQAQIAIATTRAVAPIKTEIQTVDEWANGIFLALQDVLRMLLRERPAWVADLATDWAKAADRFQAIEAGDVAPDEAETLELLEARKMLFKLFTLLKLWP